MGVVNLSPDSWYRESVCLTAEAAVARGKILHAQGADLVDVGAESTLAHAARVDKSTQNSQLLPVIKELRAANILVSVETHQPAVTRACLEAGANVLNLTGTEGGDGDLPNGRGARRRRHPLLCAGQKCPRSRRFRIERRPG